jgi:hypothetical protein
VKTYPLILAILALSACTHSPLSPPARAPASPDPVIPEEGIPLYKMMDLDVVVKSGDVPRTPMGRHYAPHELATERSQPVNDPSPLLGYHLELATLRKQKKVAKSEVMGEIFTKPKFFSKAPPTEYATTYEKQIDSEPNLLKLWEIHRDRYTPGKMRPEDGPALVNSDYEYANISDRQFGYCWGFATFNRFFAQLAFFDATPPTGLPAYVPGGFGKNETWFHFYEKKIDAILDGKAALIPGFANFRTFSQVPEIEFYIKLRAMRLWAHRAISLHSLHTFFTSTRVMKDNEIGDLLSDLRTRTERGELPKIMFTAMNSHKVFGGTADVHVVLATGVETAPDGSGKILLWDINFYAEDYIKAPKFIEVRAVKGKGRELHYGPWIEKNADPLLEYESSELGQVRIAPENSHEENEMLHSLQEFCADSETARYCR